MKKKNITKEQKRQQANKARKNPEIVKEINFFPGAMHVAIGNDACLRIIGYDAFEHFGFTRDDAEFMTSHGSWVCLVGKDGTRYASDGYPQGKDDFEFVFNTALDVLSVFVNSSNISQADKNRYYDLMRKLIRENRQMVKKRYQEWEDIIFLNEYEILDQLCAEFHEKYMKMFMFA